MKKALVLSSLLAATALTGCSSLNSSTPAMPLAGNVSSDISADIAVGEKISGSASATKILFFTVGGETEYADGVTYGVTSSGGGFLPFSGADPVSKVKAAAAYNAVTESGADVLVAPRYVVKQNDYTVFGTIDVTVEGYKGTINSID